jgi:hypothetical protein
MHADFPCSIRQFPSESLPELTDWDAVTYYLHESITGRVPDHP